MILCHCSVVDHRAVESAVAEGACTLREVLLATGAGRDCGGCIPAIRRCAGLTLRESGSNALDPTLEIAHAAG